MAGVITISLIVICTAVAGALAWLAWRGHRRGTISTRGLIVTGGFAVVLVAMGVGFIGHAHYLHFGFLHITSTLFFLGLALVLKVFIPDKDTYARRHKIAVGVLTGIVAFFTLFKFTYIYHYGMSVYEVAPLNACNLVAVLIILRPWWRNTLFDNYIICFGLLGGVMNLLIGTRYGWDQDFYTDIVYESNITHNIFLTYCLYMLLSRAIVPNVKRSLQNLWWLVPLFFVYVFTNQIYRYNYFFTGVYDNPILGIYQLFPTFDIRLGGTPFELNPLYYLIVLSLTALVLWGLAKGLEKASRARPPNPASEVASTT